MSKAKSCREGVPGAKCRSHVEVMSKGPLREAVANRCVLPLLLLSGSRGAEVSERFRRRDEVSGIKERIETALGTLDADRSLTTEESRGRRDAKRSRQRVVVGEGVGRSVASGARAPACRSQCHDFS